VSRGLVVVYKTQGKHFYPHGSESTASDERGVFA
jgi:hypothetical protein